jgi:hypothetical protein
MQMVLEPFPFRISRIDLESVSDKDVEGRVSNLLVQEAQVPFDLTRDPLLRATLVRLGSAQHILLLTTHHIVCDDWSTEIFLSELAQLYSDSSNRRPVTLPEVQDHYSEFVRQQTRYMQGPELELQLDYWRTRFCGVDPFHYIEPDREPDTAQVGCGRLEEAMVSAELEDATRQFSQANGFSTFMTLVGAVLCLFHCYSGKEDVGIGVCVANRNQVETETVIGPFSNRLLLRVAVSDTITIRELLERVRKVTWEAYSYQEVPYGEVLEKAAPARKSSHDRLFQVLVAFTNAPKSPWEFSGLKVTRFAFDTGTAFCDFYICFRHDEGLKLTIQYDAGLFSRATVDQIIRDYERILDTVVGRPETVVRDLPVSRRFHAHAI